LKLFYELEPALGLVIGKEQINGYQQGDSGTDGADLLDGVLFILRDKKDYKKPSHTTEQNRG